MDNTSRRNDKQGIQGGVADDELFGLKQMVAYLHQNGVTAYMEPGALITPDIWKLYQPILGSDDTPFYSYFVVDARSQVDDGLGLALSSAQTLTTPWVLRINTHSSDLA